MSNQTVIIKRVEEGGHGDHHGGGWKVAYADFMTAMMAFFLLLWILAASDEEKLRGLADYFTPSLSEAGGKGHGLLAGMVLGPDGVLSGSDGPMSEVQLPSFGQENPMVVFDSRLRVDVPPIVEFEPAAEMSEGSAEAAEDPAEPASAEQAQILEQLRAQREADLDTVEEEINSALKARPELMDLTQNVRFVRTPEGLNVQIMDHEGRSMFSRGSSMIEDHTRDLIQIIGEAITEMTYPITISGHTDAVPFARSSGYSNWELSADRANATRRILVNSGINPARIESISGMADTLLLTPDQPDAPENRRIDILLAYPDPLLRTPN
jgi:chemotaxis protein MotB